MTPPRRSRLADRSSEPGPPAVSVIVPVHSGGAAFVQCLDALARLSPPPLEVIVVEDGDRTPTRRRTPPTCGSCGCPTPRTGRRAQSRCGHRARRRALFVDADVVVPDTAVATVQACLKDPALSAVIGSYDRRPAAPNFVSQFKNLAHRFVHQQASEDGMTFWGACGAIRRTTFLALGGFDERFDVPSIEDIELGLRLSRRRRAHPAPEGPGSDTPEALDADQPDQDRHPAAGAALERAVAGRWPHPRSPERDPSRPPGRRAHGVLLASLLAAPFVPRPRWWRPTPPWCCWRSTGGSGPTSPSERGWWFALRAVPMQWLYYLYSGAAFAWVLLTGDWRRQRAARMQEPA